MKLRNVSAAACAAVLLFATSTSISQGRGADVFYVPLDGFINYNPCTGEEMLLAGSVHVVLRLADAANGGAHYMTYSSAHDVTATGLTTGQGYKFVGHDPNRQYIRSGSGTEVILFATRLAYVSKSGDANWYINFLFRAIINANGVQTVEVISPFEGECR